MEELAMSGEVTSTAGLKQAYGASKYGTNHVEHKLYGNCLCYHSAQRRKHFGSCRASACRPWQTFGSSVSRCTQCLSSAPMCRADLMREVKELRALRDNGLITTRTWYHTPAETHGMPTKAGSGGSPKHRSQQKIHLTMSNLRSAAAAMAPADGACDVQGHTSGITTRSEATSHPQQQPRSQHCDPCQEPPLGRSIDMQSEVQQLRIALTSERCKVAALEILTAKLASAPHSGRHAAEAWTHNPEARCALELHSRR